MSGERHVTSRRQDMTLETQKSQNPRTRNSSLVTRHSSLFSKTLFFRHAEQLLTLAGLPCPRRAKALSHLGIIADGAILTQGTSILRVGQTRSLEAEAQRLKAQTVDCRGSVVMPGFVDSHTHLVFAGSRVGDYEKRLQGKTYEEMLVPAEG